MNAYPGVHCVTCGLRHELSLRKPHRPSCLACGADLPWPNLDHLARRVLAGMETPMHFYIVGFAGLDPAEEDYLQQVTDLWQIFQQDLEFPPEDALEVVLGRLPVDAFGRLACALDRWHAVQGDRVTLEDLERRCRDLEGTADQDDPRQQQDLEALRHLQRLLHNLFAPRCTGET